MSQNLSRASRSWLEWTLLLTASLCTLFIWAPAADPINLPKFVLLSLGGSVLAGLIITNTIYKIRHPSRDSIPIIIASLFLISLLVSAIASDYHYSSFYGSYQRNNGLLTSLSLIILFVAAAAVFRLNNAKRLLAALAMVGALEVIYGLAQHFGADFINWNNSNGYNPIIGTLGNPDFVAAIIGITAVALLWLAISNEYKAWIRVSALVALALALIVIALSQARQGLLAFAAGATCIVITLIYQRSRRLALGAGVLALLGAAVGILGMLQIGPLSRFLYKPSIGFRGDYWRAGIRMFKGHPILGVGPDRFGAYFRQYRDATQVLRRGPEITADASHSVVIHFAATSGIFAVVLYLALTGTIIWFGIRALRGATGSKQVVVAAVFGCWVAYQAQSLISIDNLGIAVWGWALGGAIVGLAQPEFANEVSTKYRKGVKTKRNSGPTKVPMLNGALAAVFGIAALIITVPMFGADIAMKTALGLRAAGNDAASMNALKAGIMRAPLMRPSEPFYSDTAARLLLQSGLTDDGRALLKKVIGMDPRDYDAWRLFALSDEVPNKRADAVPARERIAVLDPYNALNLLELSRDLKAAGQSAAAKAIVTRINSFAPNSQEAKTAQAEFGG